MSISSRTKPPGAAICNGVKLGDARATVRRALGKPTIVFEKDEDAGDAPADVYKIKNCLLSFEYDARGKVVRAALYEDERTENARLAYEDDEQDELELVPVFVPSLLSLLKRQEKRKGSPLTKREVIDVRDNAAVALLPLDEAQAIAKKRRYEDIDAEDVWNAWQQMRTQTKSVTATGKQAPRKKSERLRAR